MPELDYRALNRRAQTELTRQKSIAHWVLFVVNLLLYLLFVVIGWGMFIAGGSAARPGNEMTNPIVWAMVMLTTGGALSVMFHSISVFLDTRLGEAKMRDQIMARLVAEEVMRLGAEDEGLDQEKAKRVMRFTDEGELEEDDVVSEDAPLSLQEQQRMLKR